MIEPITLEEARRQLREPDEADNPLIETLIAAARDHAERATGLILAQREITERAIGLGDWLDLTAWPIADDATLTLSYLDAGGIAQTVAPTTYWRAPMERRLRLYPYRAGWDIAVRDATLPVTVTISEAGYAPADVPPGIRTAMLLIVDRLYANDAPDFPAIVAMLLDQHRIYRV